MNRPAFQRYFSHPLQGIIVRILFALLRLCPLDWASALGGWIGRTLGPHLPVSKIAIKNLKAAFPDKSDQEIRHILKGTWDNLGRTVFEFPAIAHLSVYDSDRFEVINPHYIDQLRDDGRCGIFFSAHMANWETPSLAVAQRGLPIHLIYRRPDNPWMQDMFDQRKPTPECGLIPKGSKGARMALNVMKENGHLAMLVDQKMNDGIAVPFFGRDAMTAPAIAQFSLKNHCPVVPTRVERTKGANFRITFYPPMEIPNTGNRQDDIHAFMVTINQTLESWISERPEQWLWLHRRWPKD